MKAPLVRGAKGDKTTGHITHPSTGGIDMGPRLSDDRVTHFGHYWLLRCLGTCGMGEMWLACPDGRLDGGGLCVVKKPLANTFLEPDSIDRFLDEIRVSDLLDHPNIAKVIDAGDVDGVPFFALDFIEGKNLAHIAQRLREARQPFPLPLLLHLGIRVCEALAYAHRITGSNGRPLQLVHRDICPDNLVISYSGSVSLIDFGMAYSTLKEVQTFPGRIAGNTTYRSPEHARHKSVDGRSDIFSLGVVLWELASGVSPKLSKEEMDLWLKSGRPRFVSPSNYRKGIPQQLDYALMRALSNDPRDRQQKAAELGRELGAILGALAPGFERTAHRQMSQLMRSLFEETYLEERRLTARAIKAAQSMAVRASGDLFDDEPTVAVASDLASDEFDEIDESDPFDGAPASEPHLALSRARSRPAAAPGSAWPGKLAALLSSDGALRGWRGLAIGFLLAFGLSLAFAALLYALWTLLR